MPDAAAAATTTTPTFTNTHTARTCPNSNMRTPPPHPVDPKSGRKLLQTPLARAAQRLGVKVSVLESLAFLMGVTDAELASHLTSSVVFTIRQPYPGALWISAADGTWGTWKDLVVSAYYHPTLYHQATVRNMFSTLRNIAPPGKWAISKRGNVPLVIDETFYKTCGSGPNSC